MMCLPFSFLVSRLLIRLFQETDYTPCFCFEALNTLTIFKNWFELFVFTCSEQNMQVSGSIRLCFSVCLGDKAILHVYGQKFVYTCLLHLYVCFEHPIIITSTLFWTGFPLDYGVWLRRYVYSPLKSLVRSGTNVSEEVWDTLRVLIHPKGV